MSFDYVKMRLKKVYYIVLSHVLDFLFRAEIWLRWMP